jgi:hypothetical protein
MILRSYRPGYCCHVPQLTNPGSSHALQVLAYSALSTQSAETDRQNRGFQANSELSPRDCCAAFSQSKKGSGRQAYRRAMRPRAQPPRGRRSPRSRTMTSEGGCCAICLTPFEEMAADAPVVCLARCQHAYCAACIDPWWDKGAGTDAKSCPMCRRRYASMRHCERLSAAEYLLGVVAPPGTTTLRLSGGAGSTCETSSYPLRQGGGKRSLDQEGEGGPDCRLPTIWELVVVDFTSKQYSGVVVPLDSICGGAAGREGGSGSGTAAAAAAEVWNGTTGRVFCSPPQRLARTEFLVFFPDDHEYWLFDAHRHRRM